jgi:hypothetical protein
MPKEIPPAEEVRKIKREIANLRRIAFGTLVKRYTTCGNSECWCAKDPKGGHGPYFTWSRLKRRKLVRTSLSKKQAEIFKTAIRDYQKLKRLIRHWNDASAKEILAETT